jgi:hypothetical protein
VGVPDVDPAVTHEKEAAGRCLGFRANHPRAEGCYSREHTDDGFQIKCGCCHAAIINGAPVFPQLLTVRRDHYHRRYLIEAIARGSHPGILSRLMSFHNCGDPAHALRGMPHLT